MRASTGDPPGSTNRLWEDAAARSDLAQWEPPLCQLQLLQAFLHLLSLEKLTLAIFSQCFVAFLVRSFLEVPSLSFCWCHFIPYLKLVPWEHLLRMNSSPGR